VKRYGKYGRNQFEEWKDMENMEEIPGWIVKRYGNYGKK
jgi:hypothetical protein